jgi:hypothetical protein
MRIQQRYATPVAPHPAPLLQLRRHTFRNRAPKGENMNRLEDTEHWPPIVAQLRTRAILDVARDNGVTPGQISGALKRTGHTREPIRKDRYVVSANTKTPGLILLRNSRSGGDIHWEENLSRGLSPVRNMMITRIASSSGATSTSMFLPDSRSHRTRHSKNQSVTASPAAAPLVWSVRCNDDSNVFAKGANLRELGEALARAGVTQVRTVECLGPLLT